MHKWLTHDHPLPFYVAAMLFAGIALALAVTTSILAQETGTLNTSETTSNTGTNNNTETCSYDYSNWGACQPEGKRYRSVTGISPSGCVQTSEPKLHESCSYQAPQCGYSYSTWGACQPNSKQMRSLLSKSPAECEEYTKPVLERSCTYTDTSTATSTTSTTTTTSGTTSSMTTACSYSYSSWGSCQLDGKRYRAVTGISPTGCVQTSQPITRESCTYSSSSSTSSTTTTTSGQTTTADQCIYSYTAWSTCQLEGKRKRSLLSKWPSGCAEYVKPIFEQSCVYETTTSLSSGTTATAASGTQSVNEEGTNTQTTGSITPAFTFRNVTDGTVFTGEIEIRGEVQNAQAVELYLVPTGSNTYRYIGSGSQEATEKWVLRFRSPSFPNGTFYLRAKVKNQYGEYGSGQRRVEIRNQTTALTTQQSNSEDFRPMDESETKRQVFIEKLVQEIAPTTVAENIVTTDRHEQKKQIFAICESNPEKCFPERDADQDGLSDIDEVRFGTDPQGADSDLDGFIDGDEVKNGFDPVKYSPGDQSDRIVFESPKTAGEIKKNYVVENISLEPRKEGKSTLKLSGRGLPNSFVTIYIYSDPIVLTVKTDSDGNWTYELDKELEDGQHEAYVAITDNTGKITGKSEPLAFVKTAQAVTVIPAAGATTSGDVLSATRSRTERDLFFVAAIMLAALAVALATIGLIRHRHAQKEQLYLS